MLYSKSAKSHPTKKQQLRIATDWTEIVMTIAVAASTKCSGLLSLWYSYLARSKTWDAN